MAVYKDQNGVTWLVVQAGPDSWLGTPDPASARQYEPMPDDVVGRAEGAVAGLIERFAAANKGRVSLMVRASPAGGGAMLWLLVLVVAVASE